MKKESNTLIISIMLILVIALVGFNFDKITGQTTGLITTLDVSPNILNAGQNIVVKVNPQGCVNNIIGVYDDSDLRRATFSSSVTGRAQKICKSFEASFKTYPAWKPGEDETGIFFVKIFDYEKEEFISKPFTIRR